jgi:hypothetical protein
VSTERAGKQRGARGRETLARSWARGKPGVRRDTRKRTAMTHCSPVATLAWPSPQMTGVQSSSGSTRRRASGTRALATRVTPPGGPAVARLRDGWPARWPGSPWPLEMLHSNLADFVSAAVWPCGCSGGRHARMRTAGHLRPAPDPRLRRGGARAAALTGLPRAPQGERAASAARVREGRAGGLRRVRRFRDGLPVDGMPPVWRRASCAVLVQGSRILSVLHGPANGRGRGAAGGPRAAEGGLPSRSASPPGSWPPTPSAPPARGFCPSCMGRRMAEGAALLVEHVLPAVGY